MTTAATVIASAGLAVVWAAIALKLLGPLARGGGQAGIRSRVRRAAARVPSWRLFGQSVGVFDVRLAVEDEPASADGLPADVHVEPRRGRRAVDALVNPWARPRALRRRAAHAIVESVERGRDPHDDHLLFVTQLAREGDAVVREHHTGEDRIYRVYVVIDRGWYSASPPEARAQLGPFRTTKG